MQPLLHVTDLTKDFGNGKGVFNVDLTIMPGEVVGFVGPNGAGKSTAINTITGLVKPTDGDIEFFGTLYTHISMYQIMNQVGVMYSEPTLDESFTAKTVFTQSQQLLGSDYSKQWRSMSKKLELDVLKPIKKLSLGNKKKVGVIHALMHQPKMIIMDEPTSGLDPLIQDQFKTLIKEHAQQGAGVLLSSHNLSEVQEIADRVIMIKNGKVIISDTTEALLSKAQRVFRLIAPSPILIREVKTLPFVSHFYRHEHDFVFHTDDFKKAMTFLSKKKHYNYFIERPSLEEAFKEYYE